MIYSTKQEAKYLTRQYLQGFSKTQPEESKKEQKKQKKYSVLNLKVHLSKVVAARV